MGENMDCDDFLAACKRTWGNGDDRQAMVLGVFGELGEVVEAVKKARYHDRGLDAGRLEEEIGDLLYYAVLLQDHDYQWSCRDLWNGHDDGRRQSMPGIAETARAAAYVIEATCDAVAKRGWGRWWDAIATLTETIDTTPERCAARVAAKLRQRYPDGYSHEASVARRDEALQAALEEEK